MEKLIRRDEGPQGQVCKLNNPVPVRRLDLLLKRAIDVDMGYETPYKIRKNVIYSLGYLEFLFRCLQDFRLYEPLERQIYKAIVIVGMGVIEALLSYLLKTKKLHETTIWKLKSSCCVERTEVGNEMIKLKRQIFKKLYPPQFINMKFDDMVKKAQKHKIFGQNQDLYKDLKLLFSLRNRIHLEAKSCMQASDFNLFTDTDFNAFGQQEVQKIATIIYAIFTSSIFQPSEEERKYFDYLKNYPQFLKNW